MKRKRIILSVTNDLVTDQRVHRSCMALTEAGYEVTLVGRLLRDSKPLDRPYHTARMRLLFNRKAVFYAEYNWRLFLRLLFSRCDLYYANDTDTLLANYMAARLRRKPLFFDSHELFPDMPELVGRERVRHVWEWIERRIVPRTQGRCTVCQSIADILQQRYGKEFGVVRNVPMRCEAKAARHRPGSRYTLLYQGAVNVGRGIEETLAAMPYLDDCEFVVAGIGDLYDELRQRSHDMGLDDRVRFLGRMPLEELAKVTVGADLGLAILRHLGESYYYTLPNRISDFAQCGLPVLATDFPEPRRIVEQYRIGSLLPEGEERDPRRLAQAIRDTLHEWDSIAEDDRRERFAKAGEELCWEHDREVLLKEVAAAMSGE